MTRPAPTSFDAFTTHNGSSRPVPASVLLDLLLSHAPVGFALVDEESRYVIVNEALARINATPIAGHLGRRVADVLPQLAHQVEPVLRHVLDSGQPVLDVELNGTNRHGETRAVLASWYPVRDTRFRGVGIVVHDVTELGALSGYRSGRSPMAYLRRWDVEVAAAPAPGDGTGGSSGWCDAHALDDSRVLVAVGAPLEPQPLAVEGVVATVRAYSALTSDTRELARMLDSWHRRRPLTARTQSVGLVAVLDTRRRIVEWSAAGPAELVLAHGDSAVVLVDGHGPPLGSGGTWSRGSADVAAGDVVCLVVGSEAEREDARRVLARRDPKAEAVAVCKEVLDEWQRRGRLNGGVVLFRSPAPPAVTEDLARDARSASVARTATRRFLDDLAVDDATAHAALLIVSELVTNAVRHSVGRLTLSLLATDSGIRVAVADGSATADLRPRAADPDATRGRGLYLVEALSSRWGVDVETGGSRSGKTVWCEIDVPSSADGGLR